jgi:acid phosphatase type 7
MKTIGRSFRAAMLLGAAASILVFTPAAEAQNENDGNSWGSPPANDNPWPYNKPHRSAPVLAVVGDVSCQPGEEASGESKHETCTDPKPPYTNTSLYQSQQATANQIEAMKPDAVALLGDLQYQVGLYQDFRHSYDLTYGAFKMITRPAPGNHEFYDEHGATGVAGYGYFSYFNGFQIDTSGDANQGKPLTTTIPDPCPTNPACGPGSTPTADLSPQPIPRADGQAGHFELGPNGGENGTGVGEGWYSYNIGSWHLISLNIECSTQPGGCSTAGAWFAAELAWLKKDLEENHSACTLAYWHQPTFSATNGITPEGIAAKNFWQLLYEHNADLVLNGHDHLYAHYRPLDPSGNSDPQRGITEFIVGTGGETLDPVVATTVTSGSNETNMEDPSGNTAFNAENLIAATGDYWGVMALTLNQNGYAWYFKSAIQGPVNNGQYPAVAPTGSYTDKGGGTCHGPVNRW